MSIKFLSSVLCVFFVNISSNNHIFKQKQVGVRAFQIKMYENNKELGYIAYTNIPFLSDYVLYDFYIYPEYRNKGFGTKLLKHAIDQLELKDANNIYVQPGPFEIDKYHRAIKPDNYDSKLQSLIKFYKNHEFVFVRRSLNFIARILYRFKGINENPEYLMIRSKSN